MAFFSMQIIAVISALISTTSAAAITCDGTSKHIANAQCGVNLKSADIVATWEPMCTTPSTIAIDDKLLCQGEGYFWYRQDNDPHSAVIQCKGDRCCGSTLGKLNPVQPACEGGEEEDEQRWNWQSCAEASQAQQEEATTVTRPTQATETLQLQLENQQVSEQERASEPEQRIAKALTYPVTPTQPSHRDLV